MLMLVGGVLISKVVLDDAMTMFKKTSRTFYIPISYLDAGLREAVTSAYLCMRAIDEIEDHDELTDPVKVELLQGIHKAFLSQHITEETQKVILPYKAVLPQVTLQLNEWALLCPSSAVSI